MGVPARVLVVPGAPLAGNACGAPPAVLSSSAMQSADVRRAIETVWRIESARLIAALARRVRDVGRAEELAQEALLAALEQWPRTGIPERPGAWLMTCARNRFIDQHRHSRMAHERHAALAHEREMEQEHGGTRIEEAAEDTI